MAEKLKVLVLDDGEKGRVSKTELYVLLASVTGKNAEVVHAKMEPVIPLPAHELAKPQPEYQFILTNPKQLEGYGVILADFNGRMPGGKNHPDNEKFFGFLQQAVDAGSQPVVRMFSGGFNQESNYGIDLAPFPSLKNTHNSIVTIHNSTEVSQVIKSTIAKASSPSMPAAPGSRPDGSPWVALAGDDGKSRKPVVRS